MSTAAISNEISKSDFWQKMEELDRAVARFQASVEECCQAIAQFKAHL
jgi:hypothetical protein